MDNEQRKLLLMDIQMKKMEVKSELNKISFLLKQNKIFEKEANDLLDRLNILEKLENEIKKMK